MGDRARGCEIDSPSFLLLFSSSDVKIHSNSISLLLLSMTRTHTYTHTHSLSVIHTHTHSFALSLTASHSLSLSISLSHTHKYVYAAPLQICLKHTNTYILLHTDTHISYSICIHTSTKALQSLSSSIPMFYRSKEILFLPLTFSMFLSGTKKRRRSSLLSR